MGIKQITCRATILGETKELVIEVPSKDGFVFTNEFCPSYLTDIDLLSNTALSSYANTVQGETLDEFLYDCDTMITNLRNTKWANNRFEAYIEALFETIDQHLFRCNRIICNDMLIYVDCLALLLKTDGFSTEFIKEKYLQVVKMLIDLYGASLKDQYTLQPFKYSPLYRQVMKKLKDVEEL
jgi:hypothetical protein